MTPSEALRLCELLSARLSHELIRPLQAIGTGCDLLDAGDADFVKEAAALLKESARQAANQLQFYRFAYGFPRSGKLAGAAPHALADGFFSGTRIACEYGDEARGRPLDWQKLACNLLVVAAEALPRGGQIALSCGSEGPEIDGVGEGAAVAPEALKALQLLLPQDELGARTAHAYFTGVLAQALGVRLSLAEQAPGRFRLVSRAISEGKR